MSLLSSNENGKESCRLPKIIHVQGGEHEEEQCIYDENQNLVNDQDSIGMIGMHEVFIPQRVDVAKLLIRHKVDIDITNH